MTEEVEKRTEVEWTARDAFGACQSKARRTLPEVPVVEVEKSASKTGSFLPTMTNRDMAMRWLHGGKPVFQVVVVARVEFEKAQGK